MLGNWATLRKAWTFSVRVLLCQWVQASCKRGWGGCVYRMARRAFQGLHEDCSVGLVLFDSTHISRLPSVSLQLVGHVKQKAPEDSLEADWGMQNWERIRESCGEHQGWVSAP